MLQELASLRMLRCGVKIFVNPVGLLESSRRMQRNSPLCREVRVERSGRKVSPLRIVVILFMVSLPSHALPWNVHAQPARLFNGAPVLFEVKPPTKLDSLAGTWLGHELTFTYSRSTKTWFALAGVSIETMPGKYTLELTGQSAAKTPLKFSHIFTIARAQYPKIKVNLAVEKKFTEPTPEQQAQIADSVKVKQDYLGRVTPDREWDGKFAAPVDAATSDVFGSQRI